MDKIVILYVEDEDIIRKNTKRPLEYLCDELITASSAKEGLELYKKYKPNIIISDIKMPYMSGIEMAKEIKSIDANAHIIFTTAHGESEYFIEAIDMQVDGYILKPIDYDLLENKIKQIIEQIDLKIKLKQQETKIYQQKLQILEQSKNTQMGEMIGNIAHQWRQPLSVISTLATSLILSKKQNMLDDETFYNSCKKINETVQHLSKTIDIFRDYIKEKKEYKRVVLQQRIQIAIDIVEASLKNHHIKLINNIHNIKPIEIEIVVGELSQVIINILNNAKDVLVQNEIEDKWIKIDLKKMTKSVTISIEDNGGGVPQEIMSKIFDPYFTTKHKSQGTGLGLHISKDIIEKSLHGKINVTNSQYGAVFTIILPLN